MDTLFDDIVFQKIRPETASIIEISTEEQRLDVIVKDATLTFREMKSLTFQDSCMLMRALVGYLSIYAPTIMPETVLHNLTIHAVVQLFPAIDGDYKDDDAEEVTDQWATLFVEPEICE